MAQGITFSGLGSGLDTDSIISQLIEIERRPVQLVQNRQARLEVQKSVVQSINTSLLSLKGTVEELAVDDLFSIVKVQSDDNDRISAEADNEASPGSFSVEVEQLAQARSLSSRSFSSLDAALNLGGEFVINGQSIEIEAEDALVDISAAINAAGAGVSAQILTVAANDNRLILTAGKVGRDGFDIKDASTGNLLQSLGFTSAEESTKNAFASGGASALFLASDQSVGSLLGLGNAPSSTVTIGGEAVAIDLQNDSLEDIRDRITAAAPAGVTAAVVSVDEDGLTRYRLEIDGTTDFVDDSGVLETLDVLDSSGGLVNEIPGGAESDQFSSTSTAVGALLGLAGAPTGTVQVDGVDIDVNLATDSLTDIQTSINDAGIAGVNATVTSATDEDGNALFRLRIDGATAFADDSNVLEALGVVVGSNKSFESVAQNLTGNVANQQKGAILNPIAGGAKSDALSSDTDPAGVLVGSAASGAVTIGDKSVSIDLAADSLVDIRDKINAAAPTGVVASINIAGPSSFELQIDGTTQFDDANGVLQALGVLGAPAAVTASTTFAQIAGAGITAGDTVSISGKNHNGDQVAGTFTVTDTSQSMQDLLDNVEQLFGNDVSASLDAAGRIVVTDDTAGSSQLSVNLQANNQGGGAFSLGSLAVTTQGRDARSAELQAGQDAVFRINGISLTRTSNTITDAVQGVTLNLKEAEVGKLVNITVTRDDTTQVREKIAAFVEGFNASMTLIDEQFTFDETTEQSGPLSGDATLLTLQTRMRTLISNQVSGLEEGFNALVLVGINFDRTGHLSVDDDALSAALNENLEAVRRLFVAEGKTTDGSVEFISSNSNTRSGDYALQVTQAAQKASLLGSIEVSGGLAEDQTLTVTDKASGREAMIDLNAGDTLDQIVTKINTQMASAVAEVRLGSVPNTTDGTTPITAATTFAEIFGAGVQDGDTIRINGTDHEGANVSSTFTISDATTRTVGDLLDSVRNTFGSRVSAIVDDQGRIQITDNQVGDSDLVVVLIEENEGGGSLDLGSIDEEVAGRESLDIAASNQDGKLALAHNAFGGRNGFTVAQSIDQLGLATDEVVGADVQGTINGEAGDGFGRILSGPLSSETISGLSLRVTATSEDVAENGQDRGTVQLVYGIARQLADELNFITDQFDGSLKSRQDSIDDTIDDLGDQVLSMERRIEQKRLNLVRQFASLEGTIANLQSQGNFLTSQLSGLSGRSAS